MSITLADLEYVVPVKIGTPGVTVNLDFDTGTRACFTCLLYARY